MTDLDVINFITEQAEMDQKFRDPREVSEEVYDAYVQGQKAGVRRAMAYLRENRIFEEVHINGTTHYVFIDQRGL